MVLAAQLKMFRQHKGLSQSAIAEKLNVSRQSVSKWETGKGYPDIENLILLSKIYEVSIDELVQENKELQRKIEKNKLTIEDYHRKIEWINKQESFYRDEGLLLLIAIISLFSVTPLGLLIAPMVFKRNKKSNTFYKLINFACVCCFMVNLYVTFQTVENYFFENHRMEINYIPNS